MTVTRDATFSGNGKLRFELRRWWKEQPARWLAVLMLNPSDAGKYRDDPTANRVTRFAAAWGYDGWIGVNAYPLISSDPKDLYCWRHWDVGGQWDIRDRLLENLRAIRKAAGASEGRMVAFGNGMSADQPWMEQCLEAFGGQPGLICLGTTRHGWPIHPLARGRHRVPDGALPMEWRRP